jgi:hypothetical protein
LDIGKESDDPGKEVTDHRKKVVNYLYYIDEIPDHRIVGDQL